MTRESGDGSARAESLGEGRIERIDRMPMASPCGAPVSESGSPSRKDPVHDVRRDRALAAQALACYARLSRMMHSLRWRRQLRANMDRLREARELEAPVRELLSREPGRSLKGLRARRERLEGLARRRLWRLMRREGLSYIEVLGHLERLLCEPVPPPPGLDEPVLLEGTQSGRHLLSWPGTWVFALFVLANRYGPERFGHPGPLLGLGAALVAVFHFRYTGRFWLTSKRLVWQPRFGTPVQVSLASISPGGIQALPAWGEVRVDGDRSITIRHVECSGRLAALLDLHRCAPFLGAVDGRPRVNEVSVVPAWRLSEGGRKGERMEPGVAVLRPGYAAFLPAHRVAEVFRGWVGPHVPTPEVDVTLELLVDHLRLLPEADFDAHLRQAVFSHGGELWLANEVRSHSAPGTGRVFRLGGRGRDMELKLDLAQAEAVHRIARQWPQA